MKSHLILFLQLETLTIKFTDDKDCPEKTREECRPGVPYLVLSTKPTVSIIVENPTQRSGLFTVNIGVGDQETTKQLTEKIAKLIGLKGYFLLTFFFKFTVYFI